MKYELVHSDTKIVNGKTLTRIRALVDIPTANVKAAEIGGYIESELNLSQEGTCWVCSGASVLGYSRVSDNARIAGISRVFGTAAVFGDAHVSGNADVYGNAVIFGQVKISGDACVSGTAQLSGDAHVSGDANVTSPNNVMWFPQVGLQFNTLTVYACRQGQPECNVDNFQGTVSDFLITLKSIGDTHIREEYAALIEVALKRINRN